MDHSHLNNELLYSKYCSLINQTEGIYKNSFLESIPSSNETRTVLIANLLGTSVSEAMYLLNYLHKSLACKGDVCEFGVAQGLTSALLAHEIKNTDKSLWLFDSFQGLPKPSPKDELKDDIFNLGTIGAYEGTMSCPESMVRKRLAEIQFPEERTKVIPGFIEEVLNRAILPECVCFAYIDFDFYEPILAALDFLSETLTNDGYIVVDDYDFFSTGAKTAVDEFLENHSHFSISFPIVSAGKFCILKKQ